ncbi:MAG: outer membrane protein assembly factor BamD [Flavobacterium sp.]|jgi:outer membrane protein assembly factor BamD
MKKILTLLVALFLISCSDYQKALKSEDVATKFSTAEKMYNDKKYTKAIALFEQIAPAYRGKPTAENLFFMYSQSLYKTKQFYSAGYQFESFSSSYPKSERAEEAAFLGSKSFSKLSPTYSLDQGDTAKAIDKVQNFIDRYPNSTFLPEANEIVKMLRNKIEKKEYEIAKQLHTISNYKAAMISFDNFISDFPGTPYKEDALFYKYDSAYLLAVNSIPAKLEERLLNAKVAYSNLIKFKEDTKYLKEADSNLKTIESELQRISNK